MATGIYGRPSEVPDFRRAIPGNRPVRCDGARDLLRFSHGTSPAISPLVSRALDDSDTALSIHPPDVEEDEPRKEGYTRFLGDKDESHTRLSAGNPGKSKTKDPARARPSAAKPASSSEDPAHTRLSSVRPPVSESSSETRPSSAPPAQGALAEPPLDAGDVETAAAGDPDRADVPESFDDPEPADDSIGRAAAAVRRDPSRFGLEVRSDGRSFYLPAPLAAVMAACVVLVGVLAAFDPGDLAFAVVDRHADRIARWETLEQARRQAAVDAVEEPLRALRRQALQRGLPPEGALAPSACAGEPAEHLDAHADEIARLSSALATAAAGDESPDAHLPSRSPIDLTKGEFFLAPDTHIPGTVRVTSSRGPRSDPIDGDWKDHKGIDISAPIGTPVITTADGTVVYAGAADPGVDHLRSLLGTHVVVEHGETGFVTLYAHLSRADVKEGQTLESGDPIGQVGSTGRSTGPHLHYQIMKGGRSLDPLLYIADVVLIEDGEAIRWRRNR